MLYGGKKIPLALLPRKVWLKRAWQNGYSIQTSVLFH